MKCSMNFSSFDDATTAESIHTHTNCGEEQEQSAACDYVKATRLTQQQQQFLKLQ